MIEGLFSPMHLILVLVIVMIIFGPGKLPELGNALGKAVQGFKNAASEAEKSVNPTTETKTETKTIAHK